MKIFLSPALGVPDALTNAPDILSASINFLNLSLKKRTLAYKLQYHPFTIFNM